MWAQGEEREGERGERREERAGEEEETMTKIWIRQGREMSDAAANLMDPPRTFATAEWID